MPYDLAQRLALFRGCGFIKRKQGPVHLALRKVGAQVARDPELAAGKVRARVMAFVDFVGVIELAIVFCFAVLVVGRR